jgi:hypothetical protein
MDRRCFICSVTKDKARKIIDIIEKQFFEVVYETNGELIEIYIVPDGNCTNIDAFYSVIKVLILEIVR